MIDIENVTRLDDDEVIAILRFVDANAVVTVLAGASHLARERVISTVGRRVKALLVDDMALLGDVGAAGLAAASATFARQLCEAADSGDLPRRILERLDSANP